MGLSPFVVHHERESSRFDLLLARQSEMRNAFYTRCIQKVPAVYLKLTRLSTVTSRQVPILSAVVVFTCSHSLGPTFDPDRHRFAGGVVGLYSLEVSSRGVASAS